MTHKWKIVSIVGAVVLILIIGSIYYWGSEKTITCTVTDKDRTTASDADGNSRSIHRVYTDECGTLEVSDVLLRGSFDSADIYAGIEPDHQYEFTTIGWRVPLFSMFPKIINAKEE